MRFSPTTIDGVVAIELEPIEDERGLFARAWCRSEFAEQGVDAEFVQENVGYSFSSGTLRGLHFQRPPHAEAKLVRCTAGAVWDVAVDLRPYSSTYRGSVAVELRAERRNMVLVPEGCAHGYLTLTDAAEVRYLTSRPYAPESAGGARYDDPALGIEWPTEVAIVSAQDASWPLLLESERGAVRVIILDKALEQREAEGNPVRIALVGAGYMARGIAAHAESTKGVEIVAIANRTVRRAADIYVENRRDAAVEVSTTEALEDAVARRLPVVTDDPLLLCRAEGVDVVMDATGEVRLGLEVALEAIANGKHIVLVNAELDATLGPVLKARASAAGVVITNTDGDEPGVTMNLFRYVSTIGLRPLLVGNIKGFIDQHRNPDTQRAFAESVGQGPKMITSFADGTKLSMETTLVANATGFRVAQRGMRGLHCAHVKDVLSAWEPDELLAGGFVDYVLGAEPGTGAFVVGHSEHHVHREYLRHFKMGDGPFYVFYTPWHLPQAEACLTAARAALFGDASVTPLAGPQCDVVTIAKRDLRAGDVLDGIGGFLAYGTIENAGISRRQGLLPMGLSEGCELLTDVAIDQAITYDDVRVPDGRLVDSVRREQDELFAP